MAECARICLGTVLSSQQHQRLCTRCASICCLLLSYFYSNVYCKDWHLCGWVSPELQELKCTSACQQVEMPSLNIWKMQNAHIDIQWHPYYLQPEFHKIPLDSIHALGPCRRRWTKRHVRWKSRSALIRTIGQSPAAAQISNSKP